ncbi:MAG: Undecaprenyl diphosphate synthase [Brockia lithotrophica]|uniref:Isoprenyl transferase n=1 Tax=Brockia lithotrophica TaxID=933949 RepID=A0A2T5G8Y9_9BACL|nr:isoprenyl transferase [Brockia lithotrophica]PTQ52640.1 MAG: Undecaprenyl diphosphate synthase [Brockia lithotrophica]
MWPFGRGRARKREEVPSVDRLPKHVAIIMDGNGRWAQVRGLPRIAGHEAGMRAVRRTVRAADEFGIRVLTLYAFSTENWRRPREEVDFLLSLPTRFLEGDLPELKERNVSVRVMGFLDELPAHTRAAVERAVAETRDNTGLILNFALNYGSRREIVHALRRILLAVQDGELAWSDVEALREEDLSRFLLSAGLPDPDLIIRTGGEMRLSNFLLWQAAYAELWFTPRFWPDFTREDLLEALRAYAERERRFGALGDGGRR